MFTMYKSFATTKLPTILVLTAFKSSINAKLTNRSLSIISETLSKPMIVPSLCAIPKISYKVLNIDDALVFSDTGYFFGTPKDMTDGYIHLSANFEQCKYVINKFHKNQSIVVYKLDNTKLRNIGETHKNNNIFLRCDYPILSTSILTSITIHPNKNCLKINHIDAQLQIIK